MDLQQKSPPRIDQKTGELINLSGTHLSLSHSIFRQLELFRIHLREGTSAAAVTDTAREFHAVRDYSFMHPERMVRFADLIRAIAFTGHVIEGSSPLNNDLRRAGELLNRSSGELRNHTVYLLTALANYKTRLSFLNPGLDGETFHFMRNIFRISTERNDEPVFKILCHEAILRAGVALHDSPVSSVSSAEREHLVAKAFSELERPAPALAHLLLGMYLSFRGEEASGLTHIRIARQFSEPGGEEFISAIEMESRILFKQFEYDQAENCCIELGRLIVRQPNRYDQMRRRNNLLLASIYQLRGSTEWAEKLLAPENSPSSMGGLRGVNRLLLAETPPL